MFHLAVVHSTQGEDFAHCCTQHTGEDFSHCRTQHAGEDFTQCRTQHAGRRLLPTIVHSMQEKTFATVAHSMQERTSPNVAHSTGCSGRSVIGHHTPQKPVTMAETFLWSLTSRRPLLMTQAMLHSKHGESTAEKQPVWPALFLPLCVRSSQHDLPSSFLCVSGAASLNRPLPFVVSGAASLNHPLPSFVWQEQPTWPALFHPLCDRSSQLDLLSSILCVKEAANLTCSLPSFVWQEQPTWSALFHPILCVTEGANLPTLPHKETQAILPDKPNVMHEISFQVHTNSALPPQQLLFPAV